MPIRWFILNLLVSVFAFALSTQAEGRAKVGVIVPLSGPLAEFGIAMQNGIQMAQGHQSGSLKNIEIIFEDSQYKPQNAISILRRFASDPEVKFVINFGCPTSQALAPIVEQLKIPTAFFCSAPLLSKGRRYSFVMTSPANEWASILNEHLSSNGFENICMVLTDNDYLVSEYNALAANRAQKQASPIAVVERYSPGETDFRSSVLKIASQECDALGVYLLPGQIRAFFEQSRQIKLPSQIFGTDVFESKEEIAASHGGMEGAAFVNIAVPNPFRERYLAQFHNDIQATMGCVTHDVILRVGQAMSDPESVRAPDILMARIEQSGESDGACGRSSLVRSETGERFVRFPLALKSIKGNEIHEIIK